MEISLGDATSHVLRRACGRRAPVRCGTAARRSVSLAAAPAHPSPAAHLSRHKAAGTAHPRTSPCWVTCTVSLGRTLHRFLCVYAGLESLADAAVVVRRTSGPPHYLPRSVFPRLAAALQGLTCFHFAYQPHLASRSQLASRTADHRARALQTVPQPRRLPASSTFQPPAFALQIRASSRLRKSARGRPHRWRWMELMKGQRSSLIRSPNPPTETLTVVPTPSLPSISGFLGLSGSTRLETKQARVATRRAT